MTSSEQA